jgi:diguanylate cyclase (GGDEF)-like protein/PAS domain S-box-containing protein
MVVKLMTGVVSFYVAINVWRVLPTALKLPSSDQLSELNKNLAASEARYRELFETANEGVLVIDGAGHFALANQAMADMLGVDRQTLLRSSLFDFVIDEDRPKLAESISREINGKKYRYEIRCRHFEGKIIHTLISSSQICDSQNNVTGLLKFVTDLSEKMEFLKELETLNQELEARVTERTSELKNVNAKLTQKIVEAEKIYLKERESKTRLDAVYNLSPNGIIITNRLGVITDVNVAAEAMFGYRRSELITKHVNMLTPAEFSREHTRYIKDADNSLTSKKLGFGRRLIAKRRYDLTFPVDVALTKIAHSEEHYYMAVIRDLTEIDVVENELRSVNERLLHTIDTLKHQSHETLLLNEYTEMLQTSSDFSDYPHIVNSYCRSVFNSVDSKIYLIDRDRKLLSMAAGDEDSMSIEDCWALKANKPYPLNERQRKIPCKHLTGNALTICLPLSAKGSLLGLITIYLPNDLNNEDGATVQPFEKTLQAFAVRTSICLASLKLLKEKEMQSFKDELTGLYNRRFMNETLSSYLPRSKRENRCVTVLMIDVDHFKQFNDNYGHNLGDGALVQVAHCIEQCMRETDLVCRFGGEEFLAVMYDATEEDGVTKANNIHAAVQTINNLPLPITVSIGVAEKSAGDTVEALIRNADIALYDAKENGRNQTQRYTLHQTLTINRDRSEDRPGAN